MKWLFIFTALLFRYTPLSGQPRSIENVRAHIITNGGNHLRGTLNDVSNEYLYVEPTGPRLSYRLERIPLSAIRKVVVRFKRRTSTVEGAVVGGGLLAFITIRSSQRNPFRSPVLFGINLAASTAVGAAGGALLGSAIGPRTRKTIRPFGQTTEQSVEQLRRQLEPFTYTYQSDILNRIPR
jgi:hypothetical protein